LLRLDFVPHLSGSLQTMRIGTVSVVGSLLLGTLLGFIAATSELSARLRADSPKPATRRNESEARAAGAGGQNPPACAQDLARGELLALARADAKAAEVSSSQSGKKLLELL
jgi:hypothetical protein